MSSHNERVKLQIRDTLGQERFHTFNPNYFRGINGVILVYDVTKRQSFDSITRWLHEIDNNCQGVVHRVLVGNKNEGPEGKVVPLEDAEQFASQMDMRLFETSAKDDVNVEEMFMAITELMLQSKKNCQGETQRGQQGSGGIQLGKRRGDRRPNAAKSSERSGLGGKCSI